MADLEIIIIGAGGHARVLIEILRAAEKHNIKAVDINTALHGTTLDDVPVIGDDSQVLTHPAHTVLLVNGQGNVPGNGKSGLERRRRIFELFVARGYSFTSVISKETSISRRSALASDTQVITGAIIHPGVRVGRNVIINTGARVDHDCQIGDHSHIAPGAVLCGGVTIGPECHIGAGAAVNPRVSIGAGATVGAGAAVVADVPPGATVVGVPARRRD